MKIILVFVTTLDGKITRWGDEDVKSWSSEEDKEHFRKLWHDAKLIVMGSATWDAETITASEKRKVIVMTQRVDEYKDQMFPGCIQFMDESPASLAEQLAAEGYEEMLLVGGARLATSFLKENLVDEIILTIEPRIFGTGGNFVAEKSLDIFLELLECTQMNKQGTLVIRYKVLK